MRKCTTIFMKEIENLLHLAHRHHNKHHHNHLLNKHFEWADLKHMQENTTYARKYEIYEEICRVT